MADSVKFIISAVNNASGVFKGASDDVSKFSDKVKASYDRSVNASKIFAAGVGVALVGIGVALGSAVKDFQTFEKTMSGVKAVIQPTAEEFANLSLLARDLGSSTVFTAQQVAEAMEIMGNLGYTTEQVLGGATESVLSLASAAGSDLNTAAETAKKAMDGFGLSAVDLEKAVNSITGVTIASSLKLEDYRLAIAQAGAIAGEKGVSFDDFNAAITATSYAFASGSDAGTSFKTFLTRLVPQSDEAASEIKNLGLQFYNADGSMRAMADIAQNLQDSLAGLSDEQKNASLSIIFGSDAIRTASALAATGSDKFNEFAAAIQGTDAAAQAATRLDNLAGDMEKLSGSVSEAKLQIGEALTPAIRIAVQALTVLVDKITENFPTWEEFGLMVENNKFKLVALAGAIAGPLVLALYAAAGAFITFMAPLIPFMAAGAAIALVVYGIYKAFDSNFLGIKDLVVGAMNIINAAVSRIWNDWGPSIMLAFEAIKVIFTVFWAVASAIVKQEMDLILSIVKFGWETLKATFQLGFDLVLNLFTIFYDIFTGNWRDLGVTILDSFSAVWEAVKQVFSAFITAFKGIINALFPGLLAVLKPQLDTITSAFTGVWNGIKDLVSNTIKSIGDFLNSAGKSIMDSAFGNMLSGIAGIAKGIFNSLMGIIEGFINKAIDAVNKLIEAFNKVTPGKGIGTLGKISIGKLAFGGVAGKGGLGGYAMDPESAFVAAARFASGGLVSGPRGVDQVPAMLSAGEIVLNAGQQQNVAQAIEGGKSGVVVNVYISGNNYYGDDDEFAQKIAKQIFKDFSPNASYESY